MANAALMAKDFPVRAMIVGYPGTGKTGSLVSLLNAGFKMRILAYDKLGNMQPLFTYGDPAMLKNLDIVLFEDKMRLGPKGVEPVGVPTAFKNGLEMMNQWKYKNADGTETDLGKPDDWGPDTIVVLDSLTAMGDAAMKRVRVMQNKTLTTTTQQVWGVAQAEQEAFIEKLTASANRFHVIVLSHLTMVSPKDVNKDDSELSADLKKRMASVIPTKLFPSALGQALPQKIGGHFPTLLQAKSIPLMGNRVKRILETVPQAEIDLKLPALNLPAQLDISDGMLKVFQAASPASVAALKGGAGSPASVATEDGVNE